MAALLPGSGNTLWLGIRLGTGWWVAGGWCSGCWMGFGVGSTESFSFSGLEKGAGGSGHAKGGLPAAVIGYQGILGVCGWQTPRAVG